LELSAFTALALVYSIDSLCGD